MDGASKGKGAGIDIILANLEGSIIEQSYTLGFPATNNKVEYEAVIAGLRQRHSGISGPEVRCDSLLVVS